MTKKENIKDGLVEDFYDNGQLKYRGNYKDGKRDGLRETFYLKSDNNPFFLHDPIESRGNFKDGEHDGLHEEFDKNGQLIGTRNFKNGQLHRSWEWFDGDSHFWTREHYKKGNTDYCLERYYKNGQLHTKIRGHFNIYGELDGLLEYFDKDGNLTHTEETP